jgi:anti-sigma regulatory factor (Ser/Thr protein kinase)
VAELDLPPEPASSTAARLFAVEASGTSGDVAETVALLTSELASNAVLHARTPFTVEVRIDDHVLQVRVTDANPVLPNRKDYGTDAITGRGLRIVEGLADRWGVEPTGEGKVVWFELALADEGVRAV